MLSLSARMNFLQTPGWTFAFIRFSFFFCVRSSDFEGHIQTIAYRTLGTGG